MKDKRIIAKMVSAALLIAGFAGVGTGIYLADTSVDGSQIKQNQNYRYITGLTCATTGCIMGSLGASTLLTSSKFDKKDDTCEDDCGDENNNEL